MLSLFTSSKRRHQAISLNKLSFWPVTDDFETACFDNQVEVMDSRDDPQLKRVLAELEKKDNELSAKSAECDAVKRIVLRKVGERLSTKHLGLTSCAMERLVGNILMQGLVVNKLIFSASNFMSAFQL